MATMNEIISAGLSVLAAHDPEAANRLEAAYEVLGHDAVSLEEIIEDLAEALAENGCEYEADRLHASIGTC